MLDQNHTLLDRFDYFNYIILSAGLCMDIVRGEVRC